MFRKEHSKTFICVSLSFGRLYQASFLRNSSWGLFLLNFFMNDRDDGKDNILVRFQTTVI